MATARNDVHKQTHIYKTTFPVTQYRYPLIPTVQHSYYRSSRRNTALCEPLQPPILYPTINPFAIHMAACQEVPSKTLYAFHVSAIRAVRSVHRNVLLFSTLTPPRDAFKRRFSLQYNAV